MVGSRVRGRGWCRVKGGGGGCRSGGGIQGGCEPRIEVIVKMKKNVVGGVRWGGGPVRGEVGVRENENAKKKFGGGGQGGCVRRIEVFVKMQIKKSWGMGGVGRGRRGW